MDWKAVSLAAALAFASSAHAQDYPCWINADDEHQTDINGNRQTVIRPDTVSSQTWRQLGDANDPRALQALAGTWLTETAANGSQLQTYETFDGNGLYRYRQNVCSGGCNQYEGTGEFRAAFQGDGSIFLMLNYSDLQRSHQCVSNQLRLQGQGRMLNRYGATMRRVN